MTQIGTLLPGRPPRPQTVFLDRDGVINRLRKDDYVKSWAEFEFLPGAKEALRLLADAGYRVVVVTNQRGVARGLISESELKVIHRRMLEETYREGGRIAGIYCCPHEIGTCKCRKPEIGLFLEAQRGFGDIDFSACTVIGDSDSDMEAGMRLGCRNIFIGPNDHYPSAPSLLEAVQNLVLSAANPSNS
jgi:D-glycero-D-manno-heptose 1,7-bisphosphate phosphatase